MGIPGYASACGVVSDQTCEPERTPIGRIEDTRTEASVLAERVCALADNLVGSAPEACGTQEPPFPVSGLFNIMEERARVVARHIRDAQAALNRIEVATR